MIPLAVVRPVEKDGTIVGYRVDLTGDVPIPGKRIYPREEWARMVRDSMNAG